MKMLDMLSLFPAAALLVLTACDETSMLPDPGSELRDDVISVVKQPVSKTFVAKIMPNPIDGDGGGGPLFEQVLLNADAMFGAAYEGSREARDFCPRACVASGANWTGRVGSEGAYDIGEITEYETEDGVVGLQAEVYGEVSLVCHCEG